MRDYRSIWVAFAAMAVVVGILWFTNRAVTPKEATWEDVLGEARQGGYGIIKTEELWDGYRKDPETMLLVDTRQGWEYRTGHIKGSVNFPMEPTAWSRWTKQSSLEAFLGPNRNRSIVFY